MTYQRGDRVKARHDFELHHEGEEGTVTHLDGDEPGINNGGSGDDEVYVVWESSDVGWVYVTDIELVL